MLLTGNYRCVTADGAIDIKDAVHADPEKSRSVYNWVMEVCLKLGADPDDLVPFEKYASAAHGLVRPSSAARALNNGVPNIERTDRLVQLLGAQLGMQPPGRRRDRQAGRRAARGQPQEGRLSSSTAARNGVKGNVLGFDPDSNTGAISGHDGQRYEFVTLEWRGLGRPGRGETVDFVADGSRATQIYPLGQRFDPHEARRRQRRLHPLSARPVVASPRSSA